MPWLRIKPVFLHSGHLRAGVRVSSFDRGEPGRV